MEDCIPYGMIDALHIVEEVDPTDKHCLRVTLLNNDEIVIQVISVIIHKTRTLTMINKHTHNVVTCF
jgi:hypothetical protein